MVLSFLRKKWEQFHLTSQRPEDNAMIHQMFHLFQTGGTILLTFHHLGESGMILLTFHLFGRDATIRLTFHLQGNYVMILLTFHLQGRKTLKNQSDHQTCHMERVCIISLTFSLAEKMHDSSNLSSSGNAKNCFDFNLSPTHKV